MHYSDEQLEDLLGYGPSGSRGESRALAEDLQSARAALRRAEKALALPEVQAALRDHRNEERRTAAAQLLSAVEEG